MGNEFTPGKPGASGSVPNAARPMTNAAPSITPPSPAATSPNSIASSAAQPAAKAVAKIPWPASAAAEQTSEATYKCPRCGTNARDVARFCPRCHTTLRFECPSCGNRQRTAGKCEKCGIDFIKYIGAVVAAKKAEADVVHERLENRSNFLKAFLLLPFNGGLSLIRFFFLKSDRR